MHMQSTSRVTKNAKRLEDPEQQLIEILEKTLPAIFNRDDPHTTKGWTRSRIIAHNPRLYNMMKNKRSEVLYLV